MWAWCLLFKDAREEVERQRPQPRIARDALVVLTVEDDARHRGRAVGDARRLRGRDGGVVAAVDDEDRRLGRVRGGARARLVGIEAAEPAGGGSSV